MTMTEFKPVLELRTKNIISNQALGRVIGAKCAEGITPVWWSQTAKPNKGSMCGGVCSKR